MPLSRQELIDISVCYFEGCNDHNLTQIMDTFSADCLMRFPAATFIYKGKAALELHFKDFLGTFKTVEFQDYTHISDSDFEVKLLDHYGGEVRMKNCNIFHLDEAGLFKEIIIYNSGALSAGFRDGSE
jgi:hypothetical protein